jgi:hypothetical protein
VVFGGELKVFAPTLECGELPPSFQAFDLATGVCLRPGRDERLTATFGKKAQVAELFLGRHM